MHARDAFILTPGPTSTSPRHKDRAVATTSTATGSLAHNLTFVYNQDGSGRYGNMTCQTNLNTVGPCNNVTFNAANNRINSSGYAYDAAGNLTQDASVSPALNYQYDAEGRPVAVTQGGSPVA